MNRTNLDNLVKIGKLKTEQISQTEFKGFVHSGQTRLADAKNPSLALESRFDLAYNAAHVLALAALRWHGYRSENRYLVFQVLPDTLGLGTEVWRVLAKCHEQLLCDLLVATDTVLNKVSALNLAALQE